MKIVVNTIAVFVTAKLLPSVTLPDLSTALMVAVVLGFLNTFVKPLLKILTLPLTLLTFGLFSFVVNAALILIVDHFVVGFSVAGFWGALVFSFVLSIVSWILNRIFK